MRAPVFASGLLIALVACTTPSGTDQSEVNAVSTSAPAAAETPFPTASAQPEEMPTPVSSPSAVSTPTATPESEPTPVTTTVPVPSDTPKPLALVDPNLLQGTIFDGLNQPLEGVTVRVQSQDPLFDQSFVTGTDGRYVFNEVPTGVFLDITASRSGYATRNRTEILTPRPQVELHTFNFNRFTDNGKTVDYRLQQAPEVTSVSFESKGFPLNAKNEALLPRDMVMVIQFSEPMQENIVNASLLVEEINPDKLNPESYNQFDFFLTWNLQVDTLRVTMKSDPGWLKENTTYRLSFQNGNQVISDRAGTPRTANHFKLDSGDLSASTSFSVSGR